MGRQVFYECGEYVFRKQGLLLAAMLLVQSSNSALAFELFGKKFFEPDQGSEQVEVLDPLAYRAEIALTSGTDKGLLEKLQLGSTTYSNTNIPAAGSAGLIARARGDYKRLLATLYGEGYYAGAISIRIDGKEASELDLSSNLPQDVLVQIDVEPGPTFRFGQTEIVNAAPQPNEDDDLSARRAAARFSRGEPAYGGAVADAAQVELSQWRDAAHPKVAIAGQEIVADHDNNRLNARVVIDPGPEARISEVTVRGSKSVDPVFLRRMAHIDEGTPYSPAEIKRMRDRLNAMGVFKGVRVVEPETVGENGEYPLEVVVSDRKRHRFGVGASISTIDGLGLEAYWMHRNLFGRAERLRFDFSISGIGEVGSVEEYDYFLGASFTKPGVITPDTNLTALANIKQEFLEHYRERSTNLGIGLTHKVNEELSFGLGLGSSYSEIESDLGTDRFSVVSLTGNVEYDRRDNQTDAHNGYFLSAELEPFYEFERGNQAIRSMLEGRAYLSFGQDERTVLAVRAQAGTILGGVYDEMPPNKLFFTGGGGSVRGYPYQGIGIEVDGDTLGGRSMLALSGEIRQSVTDSIGVVGFVDAGYISAEEIPTDGDLRMGAGLGLRYFTGLGPIRFDVGVPIDPFPGDPTYGIYVGIGQAF